jgi:septal ring factor EnvC (AmiA/AmiB activator)
MGHPSSPWRGLVVACILLCLPSTALTQSEKEQTRKQLTQLQQDMQRISREISSEKARKNTLQGQLRESEINLGALQRDIRENERDQEAAQKRLAKLKIQRGELEAARDKQQDSIARELKSAYQMGRQGQVKVLFNQEEPDTVARIMAYYRYFLKARSAHIASYRETLAQIAALEPQIESLSRQLENTGLALQKQRTNLSKAQKSRELAVANLAASIESKGGKLQQMEGDRKELERLLEAIEVAVVNLSLPDNYGAFKSAKGKMPWPIAGKKPRNLYGKYRNEGKMRWQGVSIPAKEGTSVSAIHHGRVVYADWFRGSGLLLIIDHGDGYMSLYAHNQTLLREVGEWVTAGTQVSTVGSSGGQNSAALYFEVRHDGKPANPGSWCRG